MEDLEKKMVFWVQNTMKINVAYL